MDIQVFPPDELPVALGALRAIDLPLTLAQKRFLDVIARLHRAPFSPRALPTLSPVDAAAAITDPHRRKRLLQLAIIMTTIDGEVREAPTVNVARLAEALEVDERATHTLGELAAHHHLMTRFDLMRRIMGRFLADAWHEEKWSGVKKFVGPLAAGVGADPAVAFRYKKLGLLPSGTFGRVFWEHCTSRQFAFPGEPGGIPERAVFHDFGHVLAGYDTDPDGEIQQAAFQSGFVRNDGFSFLFFGIVQFHLGVKITPIAEAEVGYLDVDKVMTALARGAACKIDLSDHWDFWSYLERPLDEVRAELGVTPLAA
ncbi:MAG: hypothetical protein ABW133_22600 [Polyangiaceae bacterium]